MTCEPANEERDHENTSDAATASAIIENGITESSLTNGNSHLASNANQAAFEHNHQVSELRGKKRKLLDLVSGKPPSHPWKSFKAEGPTSFVDEGRRRSGRTNALPLDKLPQGEKRQTRRAQQEYELKRRAPTDDVPQSRRPGRPPHEQTSTQYIHRKAPMARDKTVSSRPSSAASTASKVQSQTKDTRRQLRHARSASGSQTLQTSNQTVSAHSRHQSRSQLSQITSPDSKRRTPRSSRTQNAVEPPGPRSDIPTQKLRLRLRLSPPSMPVRHPLNIPRPPPYGSLRTFLDQDKPHDGEDYIPPLTRDTVVREARARERLIKASKPGGILTEQRFIGPEPEHAASPPPQYAHSDYLVKHVIDLQQRMQREHREHKALAKRFAILAQAKWRERQPKSQEELLYEQQAMVRGRYKQVLKDLAQQMKRVEDMYMQNRLKEYQINQDEKEKQHLQRLLDNSQQLLAGRSKRKLSTTASESEFSQEDATESESTQNSVDEAGDKDLDDSASSSEESQEDEFADMGDDNLTIEELRLKYQNMPEPSDEESDASESDISNTGVPARAQQSPTSSRQQSSPPITGAIEDVNGMQPKAIGHIQYKLEEVDDVLMDDSGASSSTSGTEYSSSEEEDEENAEESSEAESNGLMGFFSKGQRQAYTEKKLPDYNQDSDTMDMDLDNVAVKLDTMSDPDVAAQHVDLKAEPVSELQTPVVTSTSGEPSHRDSPSTTTSGKDNTIDSMSSVQSSDYRYPVVEEEKLLTAVPSLLRGNLRFYQHKGLDWLAGMYAKGTNGILADEMGLGKTIQTIALLAHVATHHHIWGPHLVVVPTSVILNWEMEFKKFCPGFKILTYYGSIEERAEKRKGWYDDDRWHVCITSYQLAIQDATKLRRRNWHFLILDEAHNIKNFRSQRWQTLLGFKSQARLLLTGTPLQNNLAELWSLLFFLAPEENLEGETSFGDLTKFSRTFRRPVEQILDSGQASLDDEARDVVLKLHNVLRPHLLRRLKSEVEKQMPKKYEHVTVCRLSKRQKYLYDGYMGLAGTRESFTSGNYLSIMNCLMQLRKVCNHPDLFETRQIVTSYAMSKSVVADYEIKELLVRKRLVSEGGRAVDSLKLWDQNCASNDHLRSRKLAATNQLRTTVEHLKTILAEKSAEDDHSLSSHAAMLNRQLQHTRLERVQNQLEMTLARTRSRPVYSKTLLERLDCGVSRRPLPPYPKRIRDVTQAYLDRSSVVEQIIQTLPQQAEVLNSTIQKFGCITPAVTAPGLARLVLTQPLVDELRQRESRSLRQPVRPAFAPSHSPLFDPFHEARVRLSIAFPDKSLIQYDCGKLQKLAVLLRTLEREGHRALIFTQMVKVLDILEQFLNLHGHRYLRLDGATKVEQRQALTERFNSDPRITVFILSSRSGGLGINLTGADTVIFYDLDWNPAMDKQCQDRCHRIGQTRDVHIYRFVSEGTIEMNILRKSNQKRVLDDVVIQQGEFTTEYFDQVTGPFASEEDAETDAALDKVLGGAPGLVEKGLGEVEDKEDHEAAKAATKEDGQIDDADFGGDKSSPGQTTPKAEVNPINRLQRHHTGGAPSSPLAQTPMTPTEVDKTVVSAADARFETLFPAAETSDGIGYSLPQDKAAFNEDQDISSTIYRYFAWAYKDVVILPPSERSRKKAKKGKHGGVPTIRR